LLMIRDRRAAVLSKMPSLTSAAIIIYEAGQDTPP
jgi:hypothetical protein